MNILIQCRERIATALWWVCIVISASLFAWRVYWVNIHEIGAHSFGPFAVPMAVMVFLISLGAGAMLAESIPSRAKIFCAGAWTILAIVLTQPWEMLKSEPRDYDKPLNHAAITYRTYSSFDLTQYELQVQTGCSIFDEQETVSCGYE